ncbi:NAD(P)-binding protein [Cadophora sp. DSE1049]|nr:NAD(P)-binding protein [Cadophora sp. DSE1049]
MVNVALITGGASGMGLAVATSLSQQGWAVAIADLNVEAGEKAAKDLSGTFHRTDVQAFDSLSATFYAVFQKHGQINFVFANAGVPERKNFYARTDGISGPPTGLDFIIDIDLKSVINTCYIAQHYFRKSPKSNKGCIICTSSIAGIYPVRFCPIYTAAKHGVVGFARAICKHFYENDGIRVNVLCPGNVRTNLFEKKEWDQFDNEWIELSQIVKVVEMMLFDETQFGQVVEAAPQNHYVIETPKYNDPNVKRTLEGPVVDSIGK